MGKLYITDLAFDPAVAFAARNASYAETNGQQFIVTEYEEVNVSGLMQSVLDVATETVNVATGTNHYGGFSQLQSITSYVNNATTATNLTTLLGHTVAHNATTVPALKHGDTSLSVQGDGTSTSRFIAIHYLGSF